jgi:hypothetical protein
MHRRPAEARDEIGAKVIDVVPAQVIHVTVNDILSLKWYALISTFRRSSDALSLHIPASHITC